MVKFFHYLARLLRPRPPQQQSLAAERLTSPLANPFQADRPVSDPALFFGREDLFAAMRKLFLAGHTSLVVGERHIGKTSILLQIQQGRLGDEFVPFYIDMQDLADANDDRTFFAGIGRIILEETDPAAAAYDFTVDDPANSFDRLLGEIHQHSPDKTLVLLLDQTAVLLAKLQDPRFGARVFTALTRLAARPYIAFCFTGSLHLKEIMDADWRNLVAGGVFYEITYLDRTDARRLIQEPLKKQLTYAAEVGEALYQLTGGHPRYLQLLGARFVDHVNTTQRPHITEADLEAVVQAVLHDPPPHLQQIWDERTLTEQKALILLAAACPQTGNTGRPQELLERAQPHTATTLDPGTFSATLGMLFTRNLLNRTDKGAYYFRMDLLRRWVRQHRANQ